MTRSFIYFLKGIYLKRTRRFKLAESIWKAYLELPNVEEEACFTPGLIHALWGECCLHRTDEAHAKEHFLMVRNREEECAYTFDTWYNLAEGGNRFDQLVVGFLYYQGEVVTRNYRLAREWFYLSALQGNAAAQMNLAYMYAHGYGVEADAKQAAQWRKKAEANPSLSLSRIGICC